MKLLLQIIWFLVTAACIGTFALPGDWVFLGFIILLALAAPSSLVFFIVVTGSAALLHLSVSDRIIWYLNIALVLGISVVGYIQWFIVVPSIILGPKRRAES